MSPYQNINIMSYGINSPATEKQKSNTLVYCIHTEHAPGLYLHSLRTFSGLNKHFEIVDTGSTFSGYLV